ncbi:clathrin light chain 2 [Coffea eugenioides]|uniref:Clathrin light chain n=1 Tax=Coffea arabica TaxID=13443 RepID=A0ABM4WRW1_COFAR|nr:clathrin light chain 2 [Coffea eugenioides]
MSSSFTDSYSQSGGDDSPAGSSRPFDDGYLGYDPRLSSQRFDSFSNFVESESVKDSAADDSPVLTSHTIAESSSPTPIHVSGGGFSSDFAELSPESNGKPFEGEHSESNGPILPPPAEMQAEEGYALREWRRQNAIRLEENEKREKQLLSQIIDEADVYKLEFYKKRQITCESNKSTNRDREKVFLASQEKFHAEADKNYWKSIAELIPNEVPTIEKKGKKDQEKKPSLIVIQGPKPGKPTDLARLRQILLKLKHNTPSHLKHSPPPAPATTKDSKSAIAATSDATSATVSPAPVIVA